MATSQKEIWFGKAAVVTLSDSNHPACPSGLFALPAVGTRHHQEMWIVNLPVQLVEEFIISLSLGLLVLMEHRNTTHLNSTSAANYSSPAHTQDVTIS